MATSATPIEANSSKDYAAVNEYSVDSASTSSTIVNGLLEVDIIGHKI